VLVPSVEPEVGAAVASVDIAWELEQAAQEPEREQVAPSEVGHS